MRKYWFIAKNSFQEYLAYRLNLWLEVVGGVLFTLVTVWLWQAAASGKSSIGGYTLSELITYLIGAGVITSYYFLAAQGDEVNDDVNRGFLSSLLTKPFSPLLNWFIRDQVRKISTLIVGASGFFVVSLFYRGQLLPPASPSLFVTFIVFILLAAILHFLLYTTFALFAFWSEQTWGERFFLRIFSELASGILIPLTLLPGTLQSLVRWLPFKFFAFTPMQLYLGKLTPADAVGELILLSVWIGALLIAVNILMRKGIKVYAGEGI